MKNEKTNYDFGDELLTRDEYEKYPQHVQAFKTSKLDKETEEYFYKSYNEKNAERLMKEMDENDIEYEKAENKEEQAIILKLKISDSKAVKELEGKIKSRNLER